MTETENEVPDVALAHFLQDLDEKGLLDAFKDSLVTEVRLTMSVGIALRGLMLGLSQYFGDRVAATRYETRTRVGLITQLRAGEEPEVYDPQELLFDNKDKIKQWYGASTLIDVESSEFQDLDLDDPINKKTCELPGLIGISMQSKAVYFTAIFIEATDDAYKLAAAGPILAWLTAASSMIAFMLVSGGKTSNPRPLFLSLENYAIEAVFEHIDSVLNDSQKSKLEVRQILESISEISVRTEEGSRSSGMIIFIPNPQNADIEWMAKFSEAKRPVISQVKHVTKLLCLSDETLAIVSDGESLFGVGKVATKQVLSARFKNGNVTMAIEEQIICTVRNGIFHAPYSPLERTLQLGFDNTKPPMNTAKREEGIETLTALIDEVKLSGHGCTIVLHTNELPKEPASQTLQEPIEVKDHLRLVRKMASVDGALLIDNKMRVHAFGWLLDGAACQGEDRSKGARHNSALRYTACNPDAMALVVSVDGPVSIFVNGANISTSKVQRDQAIPFPPRKLSKFLA